MNPFLTYLISNVNEKEVVEENFPIGFSVNQSLVKVDFFERILADNKNSCFFL